MQLRFSLSMAALTAALFAAGGAGAMMPPSYKVLVVAPDEETEATSRALVEAMTTFNAFFRVTSDLSRNEARECLAQADMTACIHRKVASRPVDDRARPVVIVARPVKAGVSIWTCLGSGANSQAPAAKPVEINLSSALFGDSEARTAERRKAMACIYAAEEESFLR